MASLHTFSYQDPGQDPVAAQKFFKSKELFAIDAAVGRNSENRVDDVQLIQLLFGRMDWGPRLAVDGICGPTTLGAILDFQRSLAQRDHAQGDVDGIISADDHEEYIGGSGEGREFRSGTMYALAFQSQRMRLDAFTIDVEPLRSALRRSVVGKARSRNQSIPALLDR